MAAEFYEWLNLAIRWLHLTTGIAWIGSSFYFIWLDAHLKAVEEGEASGELWSVHGGGFYHQQKYALAPAKMPADLHWFKWEAYFTWMSGFAMLVLVYYVGARGMLVDPAKAALTPAAAIAIGLGALVAGWLVYDLLCRSAVGANNKLLGAIWFIFLLAAAWWLDSIFNSRGAYLHIGAMMGTVMAANVFVIIIPNQRKVVADLIAGKSPDPALGKAAKQRSLHNNYMTLPVLFIMISHHYPMTYGAARPWLVLALIGLTGVAVRHVFNLRHRGITSPPVLLLVAVLAIATVNYVALEKPAAVAGSATSFTAIEPILAKHCASCHSPKPTNPAVAAPPLGVVLDTYEHVSAASDRIRRVAVDSHIMPLGNPTGMTDAERQKLGDWIAQGKPQ